MDGFGTMALFAYHAKPCIRELCKEWTRIFANVVRIQQVGYNMRKDERSKPKEDYCLDSKILKDEVNAT